MKPFFKSAQQNAKKFIPSFRSHSLASSDDQLDGRADRSSISAHILHALISDNSAGRSIPVNPISLVGTQAGTLDVKDEIQDVKDNKKSAPTITVEECPTPLAPISTPKKFVDVKTKNAQYDLVVLHVAYILQKSSNLQSLILEIMRLNENHAVRESSRCSFA